MGLRTTRSLGERRRRKTRHLITLRQRAVRKVRAHRLLELTQLE